MDNIVNVISSVGFPICMALLLFWYLGKQEANLKEIINKLTESHKEETNGLKDAISKLELAITALITKLDDK